jgi:REP element-mobilizing transposase RayT
MRSLRELQSGVWYEIRTALNNRQPLFRSRQTLALFAKVLGETAEHFDFEIRGLDIKDDLLLVFCIKPEDGFKLPQIMQWLKQTFTVRYNLLHGWTGHIWGDRYWSEILEGEPPEGAEEWTGPVMGVEAAEFSPDEAGGGAEVRVSPPPEGTKGGVSPVPGKPAEIPRRAAAPPG